MERLKTLLIIGLCCFIHWCNAQQTEFSTLSYADEIWVDNIFNDLIDQDKLNMASVGIIKNGKIIYLKGYGTDIINNQTIEASACTNYRIASISKTITATLAMKLMEEGKLDLNKNVTAYVPEFPEKGIKIRHLLAHNSGIQDGSSTNTNYFANNDFFNPIDAVALFKNKPLIISAEEYPDDNPVEYPTESKNDGHYSNPAYNLLGAALERAGGAPFSQLVYEKISHPLKLPFLGPELKWNEPYYVNKYNSSIAQINSPNGSYLHHLASGGFKASVIDLTLFAQAILNNKMFNSSSTFDLMSEKHSRIKNRGKRRYGYGLGLLIYNFTDYNISNVYGHTGSIPGGGGAMYFVPSYATNTGFVNAKNGIVILNNSPGSLSGQALQILDRINQMTTNSNNGFKPKYPIISNDTNFDNDSSFYGKKIVLNNNYSPFFDTFNLVGNEIELNSGFEITSDTSFEIRLTNQNQDCPDNDGPILVFPSITRSKSSLTNETKTGPALQIFPNPASESLTIKIAKPQGASIEIYNIYGQRVHTIKSLTHQYELDVRDKESGLYIINLINNNDIIEHIKFIKK